MRAPSLTVYSGIEDRRSSARRSGFLVRVLDRHGLWWRDRPAASTGPIMSQRTKFWKLLLYSHLNYRKLGLELPEIGFGP